VRPHYPSVVLSHYTPAPCGPAISQCVLKVNGRLSSKASIQVRSLTWTKGSQGRIFCSRYMGRNSLTSSRENPNVICGATRTRVHVSTHRHMTHRHD
jgi:hypothetical protein